MADVCLMGRNKKTEEEEEEQEILSARQTGQRLCPPIGDKAVGGQVPARVQVLIVGAGLAGLAAAQRLHAAGLHDVLIFEAQSRPGGRVHTIEHAGDSLELGAQWLHGAQDNPLYPWLSELHMLDDFQDAALGFTGTFCTSARGQLSEQLVSRVLAILNLSKLALSRQQEFELAESQLANASQLFRRRLEFELERDVELRANRRLVLAIFQWFLRYETIENCCDSMDEVSLLSYTDWSDLGEGALLNFRRGYSSLLAWFCAQIPAARWLHLDRRVLNVELAATPHSCLLVRHQAADETRPRLLECQHVIVTSSLGFLKQNLATFFTPPLPETKQRLINSLGFGTVNKILLQFSAPFLHEAGLKLVWLEEEENETDEQLPIWARDIISFDTVRRQPNLLIGWIGGHGARLMERETDEQVGRVCLRLLQRFLPEHHAPPSRLIACLCSRWHSNEFTRGSYSFQSTNSRGLQLNQLHEPLSDLDGVPRLLFAGEATAGKLYSTTHGAIISGWREADRLCKLKKVAIS